MVVAGLAAALCLAGPTPGEAQSAGGAVEPPARATGAGAAAEDAAEGANEALAVTLGPETNLPLPRFVSLNAREVNVRRGPGLDYRKDWIYRREGLPVQVIDEYQHWRRIVDSDDAGGWVYHALLSGRRTVVVTADLATLRADPMPDAAPVAHAEQGVVARLKECEAGWCRVTADGIEGWVRAAEVWGAE